MARPGRPSKPAGEKFILKTFKVPPDLWEQFAAVVPEQERAERIRTYMRKEIGKRKGK